MKNHLNNQTNAAILHMLCSLVHNKDDIFIPGIEMKKCGCLILKDDILNVFCGTFSSNISDIEFSYLASYLRSKLKIHLLEKQPEFVPICAVSSHENLSLLILYVFFPSIFTDIDSLIAFSISIGGNALNPIYK